MSSLVSRPPSADSSPPLAAPPEVVTGDGWWPDISLPALRDTVRIDTVVTPDKLREAVTVAMIDADRALTAWRAPIEAAGAANLMAVPGQREFAGVKHLVAIYTRAIASLVAADLAERTQDASATAAGVTRADQLLLPADVHKRNARNALNDLQGIPRTTVELI